MVEKAHTAGWWPTHVWVVDAVEPETPNRPAFAIMISQEGTATEDVG